MWLMPRPLCWRWLGVLAARFLDCGNRWMVLACCAVLKNWWLCTKDAISQSNLCFPSHHFQSLWFKARGKWSPSKWSTLSWPPCMIEEQRKSKPCSPICKTWRQVRRTLQSTYLLSIYLSICLSVCLPGWLAGWLSVGLSVCLSGCLSVCLSGCLSVCLSGCLSVCLSVCLAGCLPAWLAGCLFVCLSVSLSVNGRGSIMPVVLLHVRWVFVLLGRHSHQIMFGCPCTSLISLGWNSAFIFEVQYPSWLISFQFFHFFEGFSFACGWHGRCSMFCFFASTSSRDVWSLPWHDWNPLLSNTPWKLKMDAENDGLKCDSLRKLPFCVSMSNFQHLDFAKFRPCAFDWQLMEVQKLSSFWTFVSTYLLRPFIDHCLSLVVWIHQEYPDLVRCWISASSCKLEIPKSTRSGWSLYRVKNFKTNACRLALQSWS